MNLLILVLAMCLVPFYSANAYLDPGSGSFIVQLVVGALLGSIIAIKAYFKKIKHFVLSFGSKKETTEKENDATN